jgi:heterodisulfide reductase subunit A-like polyferredoxin
MTSVQLDEPLARAPLENGISSIEIESDSNWSSTTSNTVLTEEEDWVYPHPTDFKLTEAPIDEIRELKVAVIGAGITGITAGILLPAKVPGLRLTILEKNDDVVSGFYMLHGQTLTVYVRAEPGMRTCTRELGSLSSSSAR